MDLELVTRSLLHLALGIISVDSAILAEGIKLLSNFNWKGLNWNLSAPQSRSRTRWFVVAVNGGIMKESLLHSGYCIIWLIVQNYVVLRILLWLAVSLNALSRCKAFGTKVPRCTVYGLYLIPIFCDCNISRNLMQDALGCSYVNSSKLGRH